MSPTERLALVEAANRAPSVHNIQPARFRFEEDGAITLLEDGKRRLFVGDPEGKDNQKSLGAAAEGLVLALSQREFGADLEVLAATPPNDLREVARVYPISGAPSDELAPWAASRATYRGAFARRADADRTALARVAAQCPDLRFVEDSDALAHIARLFDAASMEALRDGAYRAELLSWMRLSKGHPDYARDGLNAAQLALSPFEAAAAGVVLGRAFSLLDKAGAALPMISEGGKVKGAAGIALFHRPAAELEFDTGRRFYRVWLTIEREGLALCPMSVLADLPHIAASLQKEFALGAERKLVTVFRIGRRPHGGRRAARTRLPAQELLIPSSSNS
jgi:nitroreductase